MCVKYVFLWIHVLYYFLCVQFEKAHSPLLKDLMLYLKELMKDYRTDVAGTLHTIIMVDVTSVSMCLLDILASDKQLAEEIEFDLRRFEEEQKKAAAKGQTPAVITPHTKVVSTLILCYLFQFIILSYRYHLCCRLLSYRLHQLNKELR